MKKILLLLLLVTGFASAQIVNIPDAAFKAELITDGVDTNMDGDIQVSEALATTTMNLTTTSIADLTGLEAFVNLEALSIFDTSITTLDCTSNVNLTSLSFIFNNLLETVFIKNGADESTNIDPGSWSENWGFGNNPNLLYVCADEFQVAEIQAFAAGMYNVNDYCSFPPGGDYNTITGISQFDEAGDGCDPLDLAIPYLRYDIDNGTTISTVYADSLGIYNVYVAETGTYDILPALENSEYFTITPAPASVPIPVIDNSTTIQDFCISANGVNPDLEVVIAPTIPARPGFDAFYQLVVKNKGNQTLSGAVDFSYDEPRLDFVVASEIPSVINPGSLTFDFIDLQPLQHQTIEIILSVNSPTDDPPVNIDDVLPFTAVVNPIAGDVMPNDNIFDFDQVVVGPYDPNNIICIQGETVATTFIGEYLHYVINFENTGNFFAENVVITMEIDPADFDPESLQVITASDDMYVNQDDTFVEFIFPQIFLETGGHGNILMKIRSDQGLTVKDEVQLQANIYFDFNFPIETNEAITSFRVLGTNDFEALQISVYPNPANDLVNIQSDTNIVSISVYDVLGRNVIENVVNTLESQVNISALHEGVYFFEIQTEYGTMIKKIVKQ